MPKHSPGKDEPFPFDDDDFGTEPDEVTYDDLAATLARDEAPAQAVYKPQPAPQPASEPQPLPEWRKYHPAHSHTIEWADAETPSIKHTHTVYADSLDQVLVGVRQVKAVVQAAQAKARASRPGAQHGGSAEAQGDGYCSIHEVQMKYRTNTRDSWWSHYVESEGQWCHGAQGTSAR